MTSTGRRSPIRRHHGTRASHGGNGSVRSPLAFIALFGVLACGGVAWPAHAQLEVLLRGVGATEPQAGRCGRYRFEAHEPSGVRTVEFDACIESVDSSPDGAVVLRRADRGGARVAAPAGTR